MTYTYNLYHPEMGFLCSNYNIGTRWTHSIEELDKHWHLTANNVSDAIVNFNKFIAFNTKLGAQMMIIRRDVTINPFAFEVLDHLAYEEIKTKQPVMLSSLRSRFSMILKQEILSGSKLDENNVIEFDQIFNNVFDADDNITCETLIVLDGNELWKKLVGKIQPLALSYLNDDDKPGVCDDTISSLIAKASRTIIDEELADDDEFAEAIFRVNFIVGMSQKNAAIFKLTTQRTYMVLDIQKLYDEFQDSMNQKWKHLIIRTLETPETE